MKKSNLAAEQNKKTRSEIAQFACRLCNLATRYCNGPLTMQQENLILKDQTLACFKLTNKHIMHYMKHFICLEYQSIRINLLVSH